MFQKTALLIASLAASLTLAVALAAAGFAPGTPAAPVDAAAAATSPAGTTPPIQVDKVYVPAPIPQKTVTVHKVVQTAGGENESEGSEGGD